MSGAFMFPMDSTDRYYISICEADARSTQLLSSKGTITFSLDYQ